MGKQLWKVGRKGKSMKGRGRWRRREAEEASFFCSLLPFLCSWLWRKGSWEPFLSVSLSKGHRFRKKKKKKEDEEDEEEEEEEEEERKRRNKINKINK
jgi:hypothetical protein